MNNRISLTLKKIAGKIKKIEENNEFRPRWYSIFFKQTFITRRQLFQKIYDFSNRYSFENKRILDVGCGEKPYENLFRNCEYIGIDIEGGGHGDESKKVDRFYDGKTIPFQQEEFDVVLLTGVLEHAEEPEILMKEVNRVLKKKGLLFITMPFANHEHAIPFDFRRLTSFGIKKLLLENGFEPAIIESTSGIFGTMGQLLSVFLFDSVFKNFRRVGYKGKYFLQKIFLLTICFPVQASSLLLDYAFKKRGITLCYAVTAIKI